MYIGCTENNKSTAGMKWSIATSSQTAEEKERSASSPSPPFHSGEADLFFGGPTLP